jgi:beta-phosphoglucomutase-like phosphatase (HAD superfamily)
VLVDSEILALEVELAILAEQGLAFDREDYVTRFMGLSYEAFHHEIDREVLQRAGHPLPAGFREDLATRLRQTMIARLTEVPGAGAAVAGTRLLKAVASSSTKEGLERKLRQVGLWDYFEPHVYSADHVAQAKPAPDLFLHAAKQLGVSPEACLVLEDSVNGVIAARRAGMRVWGFLGGGHVHERLGARLLAAGAERLVQGWEETAPLLAALNPL